jgi:hypothetical protein
MNHKGVEYTVRRAAALDVWQWEFRIGDQVKVGKTETKLEHLAIRRARLRIDQELRKSLQERSSRAVV